jgi:hypothetical protein
MRYFEIQGGLRMPINEEEHALIEAAEAQELADESLDERDQEVARKMVSRGLLNRLQRDGKLYYAPNGLPNTWRF